MRDIDLADLTISKFYGVVESALNHDHGEFWLMGGRASLKSSVISLLIVCLIVAFSWANAVVVRRFGNTLRDSVYAQIIWAIDILGLSSFFHARVSPMEIVYVPTGQKIVFRGMDDPLKMKGVKFVKGYCAIQWFEELDQFEGWEAVRSALKSFKRGGSVFWTFYSYNPPKTLWSWVNRQCLEMQRKPGCLVHHSTYLDVVEGGHADWLGEPFIEDAEWLKHTDLAAYEWELLGKITGTGGSVFDNIVERRISDEEVAGFERVRNGVDWGWFPDPWRFIRGEWVPRERKLILFEEHSANKKLPKETGEIVRRSLTYPDYQGGTAYTHKDVVWCDDTADGKQQMADYRRTFGINAKPARKGNMRRISYMWLAGLRSIEIDPVRCPNAFEEFRLKEFERNKAGEWVDEIPDGNDHSIDAVRYMMMSDVLRSA